jgi:hypothetical protein
LAGAARGLAQGEAAQAQQDQLQHQILIQGLALRAQGVALGLPVTGVQYAVDSAPPERRMGGVLVWVTITYEPEHTLTTGNGQPVHAVRLVERAWVGCKKHRTGWLAQAAYDSAGNASLSVEVPDDLLIIDTPVPGSLDAAVVTTVCQREAVPRADSAVHTHNPLTG